MDTNRLLNIITVMIEQATREQITDMKEEIFKSRYKMSEMEIKLSVAYEELARTKEDLNKLINYRANEPKHMAIG